MDKFICIKELNPLFIKIDIYDILEFNFIYSNQKYGYFFTSKSGEINLSLEEVKIHLISLNEYREKQLNKIIND